MLAIATHEIETATQVTRFWAQVQVGEPDDCWPWTGYVNDDGYGMFFFAGRMVGAHELAVTFTTGEVRLPKLDTCHSCNRPICCNPGHLRFDTRRGNIADMLEAGRATRAVKFPDEIVRLIRERRAAGAAQRDLAIRYGASEAYISNLVTGKTRVSAGGPLQTQRVYNRRSI